MKEHDCPLVFKGPDCRYAGPETSCNKTFKRCRELDNLKNFRGWAAGDKYGYSVSVPVGEVDNLMKKLAEVNQPAKFGEWQPIKAAAPKDGALVLVAVNPGTAFTIEPYVTMGRYEANQNAFQMEESTRWLDAVTHWMPLPELPKT